MKKIILTMAVVLTATFANAQKDIKFGVRGGLDMVSAKIPSTTVTLPIIGSYSVGGGSFSTTGFYFGGFADISISDEIVFQPGLNYHTASESGFKLDFLSLPATFKYQVADKFNILAGPTLFYSMDSDSEDKTTFNLDLGASYDITENLFVDPRYSIGLSGDAKVSHFMIGLGYRF